MNKCWHRRSKEGKVHWAKRFSTDYWLDGEIANIGVGSRNQRFHCRGLLVSWRVGSNGFLGMELAAAMERRLSGVQLVCAHPATYYAIPQLILCNLAGRFPLFKLEADSLTAQAAEVEGANVDEPRLVRRRAFVGLEPNPHRSAPVCTRNIKQILHSTAHDHENNWKKSLTQSGLSFKLQVPFATWAVARRNARGSNLGAVNHQLRSGHCDCPKERSFDGGKRQ